VAARPQYDTIGKYRVLTRLGRGGMGTVLKAHDPVLDRVVALKVISSEIEVTEELRARFFREAQAGARLSHPNIVTVYDLAEADGRLVIVMEFLDGEELRQVIAQRRPLELDEKLSIMIQVCDGLGHAHHHRIVHRDIKPGNIFVLHDGSVKLLDFGVARIVTEEAGLTRTGLIMGTLRYISPEQARGRTDHRSDIFSVGAVFYELIAYRAAFPGDDPMEILEALRSHDPPLLNEVDPSVPADLGRLIARAMHKDPEQRVQDLAEMRQELDVIRRRVLGTLEAARQRVRARVEEVRRLQAAVVERLGAGLDEETVPTPSAGGLATLAAMEQNAANRIVRLTQLLDMAAKLQPAFERGAGLLAGGSFEGAIAELEPIVRDLPEHERARAALTEARSRLEQERRLARERAATRAHQSRDAMVLERTSAREAEAALFAAEAWQAAQTRSASGEAALAEHDYALATELLDEASERYRAAGTQAREIRQQRARDDADAAGHDVMQAREIAHGCDAERHAPGAWLAAMTSESRGRDALARRDFASASASLNQARVEFQHAATLAREERTRLDRQAVERARTEAQRLQEVAAQADAAIHAPRTWAAADAGRVDAEALVDRGAHAEAAAGFASAASLYRSAAEEAGIAVRLLRQTAAEAAQARVDAGRRLAEEAGARHSAGTAWAAAESSVARGRAAADSGDFLGAAAAFERACQAFCEAETTAREIAARRAAADQEEVTRLAALPSTAVEGATGVVVSTEDAAPVSPVRETHPRPRRNASADTSVGRIAPARSHPFVATGVVVGLIALVAGTWWLHQQRSASHAPVVTRAPAPTPGPGRDSLLALQQRVADARRIAEGEAAARLAPTPYQSAVEAESHASAALAADELGPAEQQFTRALAAFTAAATAARQQRGAEIAELRTGMTAARQEAEQAGAGRGESALWKAAREREREAVAAFERGDLEAAALAFRDTENQYRRAAQATAKEAAAAREATAKEAAAKEAAAREAADTVARDREQRKRLDAVREAAGGARELATKSEAPAIARDAFESAARRWKQAETDASSGNMTAAIQSFTDAGRMYQEADRRARERQTLRRDAQASRERARSAGADFLAKDLYDAGSARLGEAERMVGSQDWNAAAPAYADAAKRYADAERRVRDINTVRVEAEKTKERREQARLAGAEGLAKSIFDAATARHVEADRLANSPDVTLAIPAYREAAERYAEAERRAREIGKN
jgi:hypothetical protein